MAGNLDRGVEFVRDGRVVSKVGCCGNERVVSERFKKEYGQVMGAIFGISDVSLDLKAFDKVDDVSLGERNEKYYGGGGR